MAAVALDEDAVEGDEVTVPSALADTWTTWSDELRARVHDHVHRLVAEGRLLSG